VLLKNKALAGLAALTLVGGGAVLAGSTANAATIRCGNDCETLASQKFGATNVMAVGSSSSGVLAPFWYRESEDFLADYQGTVKDFAKAGIISQSIANTYGKDQVFQYVYAPAGNASSGQCLGTTAGSTAVTLQKCGQTASTVWVALSGWQHGNFMPLLSAALSAKSAMLLTATTASGPLAVTQMNLGTTVSNGVTTTTPSSYQMWETVAGAFNSSTTSDAAG
jgi:hypothetical protein